MQRAQLNFRLDTELLEAIKARCETDGTTLTDFIINACRSALGMETMKRTTHHNPGTLESLAARLAEVEKRLDKCITN